MIANLIPNETKFNEWLFGYPIHFGSNRQSRLTKNKKYCNVFYPIDPKKFGSGSKI